mgnify:FL=1
MISQKPLTSTTKSDKVDTMKELYDSLMNYYSRWDLDQGIWIDDTYVGQQAYVVLDIIEKYESGQELDEVEIEILQETLDILDEHYIDVLDEPIIEWN